MNIRQLRQFLCVSDTGSISRSSQNLYISQSALSRSLKNLEEELDAQLLERGASGIRLTDYGKCFLPYAKSMLSDWERAKFDVSDLKRGVAGKISIGVGPTFSQVALPKILVQLRQRRPNVTVEVTEGFLENLVDSLEVGTLDAALSLVPDEFNTETLQIQPLQTFDSVVVAAANHPLAGKHFVARPELAKCQWAIADQKYSRAIFRDYFLRIDVSEPASALKANSIHTIKSLVRHSGYLSIMPEVLVEKEIAAGELVAINSRVKPMVGRGVLMHRKLGFKSPVLRDFIRLSNGYFQTESPVVAAL